MIVSEDKRREKTLEVNLPSTIIGNANHDALDKESLPTKSKQKMEFIALSQRRERKGGNTPSRELSTSKWRKCSVRWGKCSRSKDEEHTLKPNLSGYLARLL